MDKEIDSKLNNVFSLVGDFVDIYDVHNRETIETLQLTLNELNTLHNDIIRQREENIRQILEENQKEYESVAAKLEAIHRESQMAAVTKHQEELNEAQTLKKTVAQQLAKESEKKDALIIEKEEIDQKKIQLTTSSRGQSSCGKLKLLKYLSAIQLQKGDDPNDVSGYVANPKNLKPFNLNKQKNSKFFITNYLWDIMVSDW